MTLYQDLFIDDCESIYEEYRREYVEDLTNEQIVAMIKYTLFRNDSELYKYIEDVEINLKWEISKKATMVRYKGKKMIVTFHKQWILYNARDRLQDNLWDRDSQVKWGKNIESIYPYALDMLFENKILGTNLVIQDYFKDGNLVYVRTIATKSLKKKNKYGREYVDYEREMLIEKWGKNLEHIKTKNQKAIEEFKELMELKKAPKAHTINVVPELAKYSNHQSYSVIRTNYESNENYIELKTKFDCSGLVLTKVIHSWEVYNNGTIVWLKAREDRYDSNGKVYSYYLPDNYYRLNEYNGLMKVEENPVIFTELVDQEANEPKVIPYVEQLDHYLKVSEDETEVINQFEDSIYLEVEMTKSNSKAREYTVANKINGHKKIQYFANYEGRWIHSSPGNPKVREMLDVYALADKLTFDEDEAV